MLATCRGREISINIIIQNMAQIKAMFKDSWENLTGNCDTYIYLGGNESTSHEYISKSLGKETVDVKTRGVTHGRNGSSSNNFQSVGRELLTPDEVRMIDNNYEVVIIRGERAVMDKNLYCRNTGISNLRRMAVRNPMRKRNLPTTPMLIYIKILMWMR